LSRKLATLSLLVLIAVTVFVSKDWLERAWSLHKTPRIVLVSFDTLNLRFVGPYSDYADKLTPTLESFAASGTLFEHAYTRVPITLPAHASLFSGMQPADLGVMINGDHVNDSLELLPEVLQAAGYETAAFVSLGVLRREYNLDQGFSHYDDSFNGGARRWYRTADEIYEAATAWITDQGERPFFAWIHLSDPHEPYQSIDAASAPDAQLELDGEIVGQWNLTSRERQTVSIELPPGNHVLAWRSLRKPRPEDLGKTSLAVRLLNPELLSNWGVDKEVDLSQEFKIKNGWEYELNNSESQPVQLQLEFDGGIREPPMSEILEQYELEVTYADHYLGKLRAVLEERGLDEKTLWVLVSDHGEGLRFHGVIGHTTFNYEDQLRVMWLMKGPGIPENLRLTQSRALLEDVMPTLLDLLKIKLPKSMTGISHKECWRGGSCPDRTSWWTYGASNHRDTLSAVTGYQWPYKLIWHERRRHGFFNVIDDPGEESNLAPDINRKRLAPPPEYNSLGEYVMKQKKELEERMRDRNSVQLGSDQKKMLESLGYLGGGGQAPPK
jgi:arylsulfatase A-like enzyme